MSKELQDKNTQNNTTEETAFSMSHIKPKVQSKIQPKVTSKIQPKLLTGSKKDKEKNTPETSSVELPKDVQSKMENSFGHDFSDVKLHKDSSQAQDVNAKAYAQGNEIHFAPGEYNPSSKSGQELIGHELTHVVQQKKGKVGQGEIHGSGMEINQDKALEQEADTLGKLAASGMPAFVEGIGSGIQKQDASSPPTEEELDAIVSRYNGMIAGARAVGYNVAADNLEHFLIGKGTTRTLSSSWLRGYSEITDAEETNHKRFQESLIKKADTLKDGDSITFSDYWDRSLYAKGMNELFYASGGSTITSKGDFTLTRKGKIVTITGSVNQHWHDPYDWHPGLGAFVPGYGNVSDEDAILLQTYRGAHSYEMISDWQHSVSGTVEIGRWTDYFGTDFIWTLK